MRYSQGFLVLILTLLITFPVQAQRSRQNQTRFLGFDSGQQGIGFLLGKPSGLRYSYWLNWRRAVYLDAAYDFDGILTLQGSYSFYFYDAKDQWKKNKGFNSFLFYVAPGIMTGVRVKGDDQASAFVLGLRGAGGMEYVLGRGAWAVRAELGGSLNILGRTFASVQGFIGLTHYFGSSGKKTKSNDSEFDEFENKSDGDEFSEFE